MTLHFSHIGFTEALTFIAPVSDRLQDSRPPHETDKQGTTSGPVGPTEKDSRGVLSGVALALDQRDGEAVITLDADGLDRRRADPRLLGEDLVQLALGLRRPVWVLAVGQ